MKSKASKRDPDLEVETIIQAVGARMGEQIGKIVMDSLREALTTVSETFLSQAIDNSHIGIRDVKSSFAAYGL